MIQKACGDRSHDPKSVRLVALETGTVIHDPKRVQLLALKTGTVIHDAKSMQLLALETGTVMIHDLKSVRRQEPRSMIQSACDS